MCIRDNFKKHAVTRMGFTELLRQARIFSFHVPLTQETRHMLNSRTIELMGTDSFVINASRGKVANENEVIHALENDLLAGAALDVFETEPLSKESRLRKLNHVILSPHVGAYTEEAYAKASDQAVELAIDFF